MTDTPAPKTPSLSDITAAILKMRDARSKLKKEYEAADEKIVTQMDRLEAYLLSVLNKNDVKNMKTNNATFYREETMKPSCADWTVFYAFIKENDCFDALEKRVTKSFVESYIKEHNEVPPGINILREHVVRVRRDKDA